MLYFAPVGFASCLSIFSTCSVNLLPATNHIFPVGFSFFYVSNKKGGMNPPLR